jgi:hypothetical protein
MIARLVTFLLLATVARCYPSGAPLEQCGNMLPGHGVDPITDTPPFVITYKPADKSNALLVTIASESNSTKFKGFLLEARGKWDGKSIGQWETNVPHTKTLDCFGNSKVTRLGLCRTLLFLF